MNAYVFLLGVFAKRVGLLCGRTRPVLAQQDWASQPTKIVCARGISLAAEGRISQDGSLENAPYAEVYLAVGCAVDELEGYGQGRS